MWSRPLSQKQSVVEDMPVPGHRVTACAVVAVVRTCALSLSVPPLPPSDLRSSDKLMTPAQRMGAPCLPATEPHGPRQNNERQPQDFRGIPRTSAGAFGRRWSPPTGQIETKKGRQPARSVASGSLLSRWQREADSTWRLQITPQSGPTAGRGSWGVCAPTPAWCAQGQGAFGQRDGDEDTLKAPTTSAISRD